MQMRSMCGQNGSILHNAVCLAVFLLPRFHPPIRTPLLVYSHANNQDRSASPQRNRSRSPSQRRDYEAARDGDAAGGKLGGRREDARGGFRREGRREERKEREEEVDRNYDNSVFIGNVPYESTSKEIEDMFGPIGTIKHAGVIKTRGRSKGMAYVEYTNSQAAEDAIRQFNHSMLGGREIFVRKDQPPPAERGERGDKNERKERAEQERKEGKSERQREQRKEQFDGRPGTEVFVGNLPYSTTWHTLKDIFREAGDIVRADVMQKYGKSRGFGTVVFSNAEDAGNAVERFRGYVLEGRTLEVRHGKDPRGDKSRGTASKNTPFTEGVYANGPPSSTIFVGNLPFITSQTDLFELFETIGRVTRAEIQYDRSARPSGNAVVQFELEDLADLAIKNLHRYNYGGRNLDISFATVPAVPEEEMETKKPGQDVPPIVSGPQY